MEDKKIINKLVETEHEIEEETEILDCTKEIEDAMKELLSE